MGGLIARRGTMVSEAVYAVERSKNAPIMTAFWDAYGTNGTIEAGRLSNPDHITMKEAVSFTGADLNPTGAETSSIFYAQRNNITSFDELQYFTGLIEIPKGFMRGCNKLAHITFPENITLIGEVAFYGCTALTQELSLPDSCLTVNANAFREVPLEKLNGNNVTTFLGHTFISAKELILPNVIKLTNDITFAARCTRVYVPKCTTFNTGYMRITSDIPIEITIGDTRAFSVTRAYVFENTSKSVVVILSKDGVSTGFGPSVRENISSAIIEFRVEEGNSVVEAVNGCWVEKATRKLIAHPNIEGSARIPDDCTQIGACALQGCNLVTGSLVIPSSVTSIGSYAFQACSGLSSLVIPSSVTNSAQQRIMYTTFLTAGPIGGGYDFEFGHNSGAIPGYLFERSALKSIVIPSGITSLKDKQFQAAKDLEDLYLYPMTPPSMTTGTFGSNSTNNWMGKNVTGTKTIHVPVGATDYDTNAAILWAVNTAGYTLSHDL